MNPEEGGTRKEGEAPRIRGILVASLLGLASLVLVAFGCSAIIGFLFPQRVTLSNGDKLSILDGALTIRELPRDPGEKHGFQDVAAGSAVRLTTKRGPEVKYSIVVRWADGTVMRDSVEVYHDGRESFVGVKRDSVWVWSAD